MSGAVCYCAWMLLLLLCMRVMECFCAPRMPRLGGRVESLRAPARPW